MSVDRGSPLEVVGRMGHSENLGGGIRRCVCGEWMLEDERHVGHARATVTRFEHDPPEPEPYHYAALYACEHWRYLDSSWNGTIENPSVGPYEGYCPTCGGFFKIIGFAKLAGRRVCSDPVRQGDTA
jgi:hypothetical protein